MRALVKCSFLGMMVAVSSAATAAPTLEFAGYARAGVGLSPGGGKEVCFGLAGADTKWRLGNECDYVIEPQFTGRFVTLDDKSSWGVVFMPGLYREWQNPPGGGNGTFSNIPLEARQIYFFGENIPQLANGRVWGGRRYYDRLHLDINDQFLEIHDSDGAGIEDMDLGLGKLSIAFLSNPNSEASQVGTPPAPSAALAPFEISARLTGIATVPEGALQIWAGFASALTSDIPAPNNSFRLGVYHTLGGILGGSNLVGAKLDYSKNFIQWRAVVQEQMTFNDGHTGVDIIGEFRQKRTRADENADFASDNWLSVGGRIDHHLGGPFRFLLEAGIDEVFPAVGDALSLIKGTACLAINAGDVPGSRPTFRLFYTHAFWNDAAKGAGGVFQAGQSGARLAQVYGTDASNGGSFGIQAEAWW